MMNKGIILVVDDELNALKVLSSILKNSGYHVLTAMSVGKAIKLLSSTEIDIVITDLRMPGINGMQFFEHILNKHRNIPVIFLTAYGTVDSAVNAMTHGAYYYFIKPPDYIKLKDIIARAMEQRLLSRAKASGGNGFLEEGGYITGNTPGINKIKNLIETIKDSPSSVLICGETGTGKELVARALHFNSNRAEKPFVAVNCAAIPHELIESELFGFEKGAFTGAVSKRIGKIEHASGGTLFLDEICSLALNLQAKLLRVLQENEIERLGSNKKIKVIFRLVCSTNRDLNRMVSAGEFREDLLYRINVVQLNLPPLIERMEDISLLISDFLKEFCARENKSLSISEDTLKLLQSYHWPGNIRQLKNIIERAIILSKGDIITPKELPEDFMLLKETVNGFSQLTLRDTESQVIKNTLIECNGNKSKAARMLGISRKALYNRLRAYGIIQTESNGNSFEKTCLH
ncbi:MAG: sigma-54 dependent transcriptional regulator [Thermodesulfovibrionales bacterium]|nr:sigma-54 dependent transcriptional regulator [Thermodesulfovibrionales bacterium]